MVIIHTSDDILRVLRERPEWKAEVRREILTEELMNLPARFDRFAATTEQFMADTEQFNEEQRRFNEDQRQFNEEQRRSARISARSTRNNAGSIRISASSTKKPAGVRIAWNRMSERFVKMWHS